MSSTTTHTTAPFFTNSELEALNPHNMPKHVAIIMDGNRRWAAQRAGTPKDGHRAGADVLLDVVLAAKELSFKAITLFGFSTENWHRSQDEVDAILWLIENYAVQQRENMIQNNIRLHCIGDLDEFPEGLRKALDESMAATAHCTGIDTILALNYGSRKEICRAMNRYIADKQNKNETIEAIDEATLSRYLDTAQWPDPDILIRPSGEMRLSNFLLWQSSYTELFFMDKFWPEFTPHDLYQTVTHFQYRQRRLGK